jgi:hypothetical protein
MPKNAVSDIRPYKHHAGGGTTHNGEPKPLLFAQALAQTGDLTKSAEIAGYTPHSIKTNLMYWWRDPNSPIRKAVRALGDANCDAMALRADKAVNAFLDTTCEIADFVSNLPTEEKIEHVNKIGRAMEFARKVSSRRIEDGQHASQYTQVQVAIGQMYINNVVANRSSREVVDVDD